MATRSFAVVLMIVAGPIAAQTSTADRPISFSIAPQNNHDLSGDAMLVADGSGTRVRIALGGRLASERLFVRIRSGGCAESTGIARHAVGELSGGALTTTIGLPLSMLIAGDSAMIVERADGAVAACGNIS